MISESKVQSKIIKDLESKGYYLLKLIKTNKNGIPDLLALKDNEIYFIEVKRKDGRLSKLQEYRIKELKEKGFKVDVIYGK